MSSNSLAVGSRAQESTASSHQPHLFLLAPDLKLPCCLQLSSLAPGRHLLLHSCLPCLPLSLPILLCSSTWALLLRAWLPLNFPTLLRSSARAWPLLPGSFSTVVSRAARGLQLLAWLPVSIRTVLGSSASACQPLCWLPLLLTGLVHSTGIMLWVPGWLVCPQPG